MANEDKFLVDKEGGGTEYAFRNFEPYCCGENKAISSSYYTPTNGFQKYNPDQKFLIRTTSNYYQIGGSPAEGCEIGSVPKAGSGHFIIDGQSDCTISIDSNKTLHVNTGGVDHTWTVGELQAKGGGPNGITRLGVVLVGAGGSAGKHLAWEEATGKKGKRDKVSFNCPGTGGGGGGILIGVVDVAKLANGTYSNYSISVGTRPSGRAQAGGNTILKASNGNYIAIAKGGCAGNGGQRSRMAYGGNGGSTEVKDGSIWWTTVARDGTGGAGYNIESGSEESSGKDVYVDAKEFYVSFLKDESGGSISTRVYNAKITGKGSKDDYTNILLPGGHSWGHGANPNGGGDSNPIKGGGGGSDYNTSSNAFTLGANGYWALYY